MSRHFYRKTPSWIWFGRSSGQHSLESSWKIRIHLFVQEFRWCKVLLMEEILHHLGCIKPWQLWSKLPINWCRISSINRKSSAHNLQKEYPFHKSFPLVSPRKLPLAKKGSIPPRKLTAWIPKKKGLFKKRPLLPASTMAIEGHPFIQKFRMGFQRLPCGITCSGAGA